VRRAPQPRWGMSLALPAIGAAANTRLRLFVALGLFLLRYGSSFRTDLAGFLRPYQSASCPVCGDSGGAACLCRRRQVSPQGRPVSSGWRGRSTEPTSFLLEPCPVSGRSSRPCLVGGNQWVPRPRYLHTCTLVPWHIPRSEKPCFAIHSRTCDVHHGQRRRDGTRSASGSESGGVGAPPYRRNVLYNTSYRASWAYGRASCSLPVLPAALQIRRGPLPIPTDTGAPARTGRRHIAPEPRVRFAVRRGETGLTRSLRTRTRRATSRGPPGQASPVREMGRRRVCRSRPPAGLPVRLPTEPNGGNRQTGPMAARRFALWARLGGPRATLSHMPPILRRVPSRE